MKRGDITEVEIGAPDWADYIVDRLGDNSAVIVVEIGAPDWAEDTVNQLAEYGDVMLVEQGSGQQIFICGARLSPRSPIWKQVRTLLREACIPAPRARWRL
jgi:hypothetical protein